MSPAEVTAAKDVPTHARCAAHHNACPNVCGCLCDHMMVRRDKRITFCGITVTKKLLQPYRFVLYRYCIAQASKKPMVVQNSKGILRAKQVTQPYQNRFCNQVSPCDAGHSRLPEVQLGFVNSSNLVQRRRDQDAKDETDGTMTFACLARPLDILHTLTHIVPKDSCARLDAVAKLFARNVLIVASPRED